MPTMAPHALPAEDVEAVLRMWAPSANKLDFRSTSCPASRCTEPVELPPIRSLSEAEVIAAATSKPTQLATVTEAAMETGATSDVDAAKANPVHFGVAVAAPAAASPPAAQQQQQQTSMAEQPSLLAWQQCASNAPMQQQQKQPLLDSCSLPTTGAVESTASQGPFDSFGNAAVEGPTAGSTAGTSASSALFDSFSHAAAAVTAPVLLDQFSSAAAAAAQPPLPPRPPQSASAAPRSAGATAASGMLADSFIQAAAAAAASLSPPAPAFTDPFTSVAAAGSAAAADPFSSAAAAADPFSSAAAGPPAFTDPFSQMAASHLPQPPPAPPITAAPESDFAAEFAEYSVGFGAGLHTHAANNAAVGSDLLEALPYSINTCVLGEHGDCTIEEGMPLASGSFGTVYPGYYFDDPVAVKLLRVGLGEDEAAVRSRILKEVQLQARAINHSGVVKFVAVCFSPPAIVMEMCECSLTARIHNHWAAQQQQPQQSQAHSLQAQQPQHHHQHQQPSQPYQQLQLELSWGLVVTLLRQAAAALAFLHRPGHTILHNDVRAANMVLTRTYDTGRPSWKLKICDFGLAVAAGPDGVAQAPELTHVSWRAPELQQPAAFNPVTGLYTVTPAADVYALGCVLHEMMVPGVPQQQFPPADQRLPGLSDAPPAGLEDLFQSCLAEAGNSRRTAQAIMMNLRSMQHTVPQYGTVYV